MRINETSPASRMKSCMSGMWGRNPETILVAERQEVGNGRHFGLGRRDMIRQLWTSRMITALAHLSVFEVLVE